jgi:hypothetical protein
MAMAMAMAMGCLPRHLRRRQITIFTSNQAALLAVGQPGYQSGQASIGQIYKGLRMLREGGNRVLTAWVPAQGEFELGKNVKGIARQEQLSNSAQSQ